MPFNDLFAVQGGNIMESSTRGKFLIVGAVIGFIGFVIPGLYGVGYDPPAGSPYARISLATLKGFRGSLSTANDAVFNGFGGPDSFHWAFVALGTMIALGLLAHVVDFNAAAKILRYTHHALSLTSVLVVVGSFIWAFRYNHVPPAVTHLFIADLGGGPNAVAASHYLQGQLGFGTLILGLGFLIGLFGISALLGGIATLLVVILGVLIGTHVLT
jgi:hypothetical protein